MKSLKVMLLAFCCAIFWFESTMAITVDFVPSHQTVKVGQTLVVYLHISGLEPGALEDQKIGGFDIDIGFDNQILKFEKVEFGVQLGDPFDSTETSTGLLMDYINNGWFGISENTKLSPAELNQLQGRCVSVLKIEFTAKKEGNATVFGDGYYIKDQHGKYIWGFSGNWSPESAVVTSQAGSCGLPLGHIDYCRDCGPCGVGEGDCDTDSECQSGLSCVQVTGTDYCKGGCPHPVGHLDYCRDCGPCSAGQGDCDNDGECQSGLTCLQVPGTDTCQSP